MNDMNDMKHPINGSKKMWIFPKKNVSKVVFVVRKGLVWNMSKLKIRGPKVEMSIFSMNDGSLGIPNSCPITGVTLMN